MTNLPSVERAKAVRKVLVAILIANWAVATAKLVMGLLADSAAVTADGVHSFIDGSSNVVGWIAMSVAAQPADEDHPYGHGKFEALATLAIGAMIGIAMLELGRMAYEALIHNKHPQVSWEMALVMVGTLIVNVLVTSIERHYGNKLQSPVLLADARHTLSDVFVTITVLASMGLVSLGWPKADGLVAILVLGVVAKVAYSIVKDAIGILSDSARLNTALVEDVCLRVEGVQRVKNIRSRGMEGSVYVDLIIEVEPLMTAVDAHQIADNVEQSLQKSIPQIVDVVVHVEPLSASAA